jgi:hypothetical protein
MSKNVYRYEFDAAIDAQEIEATLVLAILGAESLHGETATQLGVAHYFDATTRICVIDATEIVGRDFNSLFAGFMRREFGANAFRARRVTAADAPAVAA